jgi:WbqC-like protein family
MKVVISQSMYFPWVGLLEQVSLADIFIHYDDVQYSRGFYNRVQAKTVNGSKWITVPLYNHHQGQRIDEILIDNQTDWRRQHRDILKQAYMKAPYRDEMLALVDDVFCKSATFLSDVSRESILALVRYFKLDNKAHFMSSSDMKIPGASTQRLHDLCATVAADVYVTGHGARNYLDHDMFERSGIKVEYMKYNMTPYPQLHGDFIPYVSALDLVANCGQEGVSVINSNSIHWKDFLNEPN